MKKILYNKYIILLAASVILAGCSGHYGRLSINDDTEMLFENYRVLPDHRYYYSGSDAYPRVVIGIHKNYTLQSKLWKPVELTPEQLKKWVNFYGQARKHLKTNNGSDILTETGEKIGIWYAFQEWTDWSSIKIIDEKNINISTPNIRQGRTAFSKIRF